MFRKSDGKARCLAPTCSRDLPGWSSVSLYGHIPCLVLQTCLVSQTCLVLQTHRPLSSITDPQTLLSQTVLHHRPTNPCITDRLVPQTHKPLYHRPSCITDPCIMTHKPSSCIRGRPESQTLRPCLVSQTFVLYHRPLSCITDPQTLSCITDPCLVKETLVLYHRPLSCNKDPCPVTQTLCCTYQRFSPSEKKSGCIRGPGDLAGTAR